MMTRAFALILASPLAVALLGWQVVPSAAMLTVTEMHGFNAGGSNPPVITFIGCSTNAGDSTTYEFSNTDVGTASADRITILGILAEDGTTDFTLSSGTVGGDSVALTHSSLQSSMLVRAIVTVVANPVGTSETVSLTFSEAITGAAVCVWAGYNIASADPEADAEQDTSTTGASNDLTLADLGAAVGRNGVIIGIAVDASSSATCTGTGFDGERADAAVGTEFRYAAYDATVVFTNPHPLSIDCTGTGHTAGVGAGW